MRRDQDLRISAGDQRDHRCRPDVAAAVDGGERDRGAEPRERDRDRRPLHGQRSGSEPDPVAAEAAAVADRGPREHDAPGCAAHRHARDGWRPDRVADEPPACVDHAEAEPEADRPRLAQVPDRVGRAHGVRARVGLGNVEERRHRCRGADEATVLVDAIRDRADVVARGAPRDPDDPRSGPVGRGETRRQGGGSAVRGVESFEEQRVLDVQPPSRVPVVVVVSAVEHVRLELLAGEGRVQQVARDVADVTLATVVRGCAGDRAENVHELVHGHDRAERALLRSAGVEKDDRDAREAGGGGIAGSADRCAGRLPLDRPVVVDEVRLLALDEAVCLGKQESERLEGGVDVAGLLRQRHAGDVELPERGRAGECEEIEARRARRVLRAPPGVDRSDVADDPRRPLGQAVGLAGRTDVRHVDREARRRVGQAVDCARSDSTPRQRYRRLSRWSRAERCDHDQPDEEPSHTDNRTPPQRYRRTRASARSVHVLLFGSKCPASAAR